MCFFPFKALRLWLYLAGWKIIFTFLLPICIEKVLHHERQKQQHVENDAFYIHKSRGKIIEFVHAAEDLAVAKPTATTNTTSARCQPCQVIPVQWCITSKIEIHTKSLQWLQSHDLRIWPKFYAQRHFYDQTFSNFLVILFNFHRLCCFSTLSNNVFGITTHT